MAGIENFRAARAEECEKIETGDRVRSYDFEHRDDCYIEGVVAEIGVEMEGCPRYRLRGIIRSFGPLDMAPCPVDFTVYPPVNGTPHSFGGYCNGVRKVR